MNKYFLLELIVVGEKLKIKKILKFYPKMYFLKQQKKISIEKKIYLQNIK